LRLYGRAHALPPAFDQIIHPLCGAVQAIIELQRTTLFPTQGVRNRIGNFFLDSRTLTPRSANRKPQSGTVLPGFMMF
jgi:hypothetical protein